MNVDLCDTRDQVITGLLSRHLSAMLMAKRTMTKMTSCMIYRKLKKIDRERQERFAGTRDKKGVVSTYHSPVAGVTPLKKVLKSETEEQTSNERGKSKCDNCNQYGHITRDCPQSKQPMKCLRCNGTDHNQRQCKGAAQPHRNEANTVSQPSDVTKHAGVLLKEVTVDCEFALI